MPGFVASAQPAENREPNQPNAVWSLWPFARIETLACYRGGEPPKLRTFAFLPSDFPDEAYSETPSAPVDPESQTASLQPGKTKPSKNAAPLVKIQRTIVRNIAPRRTLEGFTLTD